MADASAPTPTTFAKDAAATRSLEQARLRKERREAKLRAGGAARLNKITSVGGGSQRDPPPSATPHVSRAPDGVEACSSPRTLGQDRALAQVGGAEAVAAASETQHADPPEVDISHHYYQPSTTQKLPHADQQGTSRMGDASLDTQQQQLRDMMPQGMPNPFLGTQAPALGAASASPTNRQAALWRILHTLAAFGLSLYIALWTSFAGTQPERDHAALVGSADDGASGRRPFFWVFATLEAVLITTRYMLERRGGTGPLSSVGATSMAGKILQLVMGLVDAQTRGYVEQVMRYGQMLSTVGADLLVCVFVLGVCAWMRREE